ncbi:MAG: hypothetical protein ACYDBS_11795 [Acidimicrobiales bacterium]
MDGPRAVVSIRLLEVPVTLWARADDEAKDLMRELALIVLNRERAEIDVPSRLLGLIEELQMNYASLGVEQTLQLQRARADEQAVVEEVSYLLPEGLENDIEHLASLMDEADEYCRRGEHLLSLTTTSASKAFRDWFFDEFRTQLRGGEPTPWPKCRFATDAHELAVE